jgi:hypothetical protein
MTISGLAALVVLLAGLTSVLNIPIPSLILGFLLVPIFITLMVCLHYNSNNDKKIFSLLGVLFASMYGVLISFNYYLQLTLMQNNSSGLELFAMSNPNSMMWVIEVLGYFFMGLSTLFAVAIFGSTLLEKFIKILFIINGLLGIGGLIGYAIGLSMNILMIGLMSWNIIMPIAALLTFFYFKKQVDTIQIN